MAFTVPFSDKLGGFGMVVLGGLAWFYGRKLPPVPGQPVGPEAFPMWIGAALILCGIMVFLGVGRSYEEQAEKDAEAYNRDIMEREEEVITGVARFKPLIPPALLMFYVFASEKLGFYITTSLMIAVLSYSLKAKPRAVVLLALLAPAFIHLIFYKLLRVPLPEGLLKLPWV
jgi:putative tricarboxylic transport membrane protein